VFAQLEQRAKPVKGGIERIIVDFVVVRSRSNSENLNISIQNLFRVSEGFQGGSVGNLKLV